MRVRLSKPNWPNRKPRPSEADTPFGGSYFVAASASGQRHAQCLLQVAQPERLVQHGSPLEWRRQGFHDVAGDEHEFLIALEHRLRDGVAQLAVQADIQQRDVERL